MKNLAFVFAALVPACVASHGSTPGTDELAGENGQDGEASKADSPHDNFDYIQVEKTGGCTNPITCAPYTLTRVNRSTIKCSDGAYHDSCKVKGVTFGKFSSAAQDKLNDAIDNGTATVIVKGQYKVYVDFLAFEASEAWISQMDNGVIDGTWVRVSDNGVRCITAPCPDVLEERLNSTRSMNIDGLDWPADFDKAVTSPGWLPNRVSAAMSQKDGAIIVGDRTHSDGATLRSVNEVFLPVE